MMPYDKALSPSGIKKFKTCAFAWHDQYVLGNKPPEKNASNRGIDLHAVLEEFFKGERAYPSNDRVLRPWQPLMEGLAAKPNTPEGEVAVRSDWTQCGFFDKDAYYRGKYDLKSMDSPDVLDIWDWKSGKIYPDHEEQGLSYSAMEPGEYNLYRTHFVYLDVPTHVESREYPATRIEKERITLSSTIDYIRVTDVHPPRPGPHCNWCHLNYKKGGKCHAAR
jgi:hypothetical protein